MKRSKIFVLLIVLSALSPMAAMAGFGDFRHGEGAVYVMSNAPEGNEVVVFNRNFFGRLTLGESYPTGGLGTGGGIDPLGSQGSLILSPNNRWLFGVNAGSNDISVFRVRRHDLKLIGTFDSGGAFPTSLAFYHNLLYVLNAGQDATAPNIAGFRLNRTGELIPLAGSSRTLPGGGYHQVGFSPHGDELIVTKGGADADEILVFPVDEEGLPGASPTISPSAGLVPFGFIFDWREHLLVAEAGSGAISTYAIKEDNTLDVINASIANGNIATCWIAGTWLGTIFTANTGSDNISAYKVQPADGSLQLRQAVAASGNKPIDIATTNDGRNLYILNAAEGTVGAFRIAFNGSLEDLGTVPGLPLEYAQGITVR
jgi:6-phosphogluconolactonase (cycloisomerase 2 family)